MHEDKFILTFFSLSTKVVLASDCEGTTWEECGDVCVNKYCEFEPDNKQDCGPCCCHNDHDDGGCFQNCQKDQLDYTCPPGTSVYYIKVIVVY